MLVSRDSILRTFRRFAGESKAAAMVEFAIVASLLLVLVFGMVDYGRYFLVRTNLTNAVRDGARYAAAIPTASLDTVTVRTYTRSMIAGSSAKQALGTLSTTTVNQVIGIDTLRYVRVSLSYPFDPATFLVIKSAKTISASAQFRREQP